MDKTIQLLDKFLSIRNSVLSTRLGIDNAKGATYNQIMRSKKVTIREIAEKMNLSKSAVALALANKYGISEETRYRVMRTAHEMGYDFGKLTAKKSKNRPMTVFLGAYKKTLFADFWEDVILGIQKCAADFGIDLQIVTYEGEPDAGRMLSAIEEKRAQGIIMIDDNNEFLYHDSRKVNWPCVVVDPRHNVDLSCSSVAASNYQTGFEATRFLMDKGHKRIAYWASINYGRSFRLRWHGFCDAFSGKGKDYRAYSITEDYDEETDIVCNFGRFRKVFSENDPPTALLCGNDCIAMYAYTELEKLGLRVPDDVSVIGFDNRVFCEHLSPRLTTCNVDRQQIGKEAMKLLAELIEGRVEGSRNIEVVSALVVRDSVRDLH